MPVFLMMPSEFVDGSFQFFLHASLSTLAGWNPNLPRVLLTNDYQEPMLQVEIDVANQSLILSSPEFMVKHFHSLVVSRPLKKYLRFHNFRASRSLLKQLWSLKIRPLSIQRLQARALKF